MMAPLRRNEGAHLREHDDQRVLAQEGRLTAHVRAGDQPDMRRALAVAGEDRNRWR